MITNLPIYAAPNQAPPQSRRRPPPHAPGLPPRLFQFQIPALARSLPRFPSRCAAFLHHFLCSRKPRASDRWTGLNFAAKVLAMEVKLAKLREGVTLVSPEERKAVEAMYTDIINQWRRRKRMFRDVWDAITENSPKDVKEFKEELGVKYDEDIGVSLQSYEDLRQPGKKRARGM